MEGGPKKVVHLVSGARDDTGAMAVDRSFYLQRPQYTTDKSALILPHFVFSVSTTAVRGLN